MPRRAAHPLSAAVAVVLASDPHEAAQVVTLAEQAALAQWLNNLRFTRRVNAVVRPSGCDGVHHPPGRIVGGSCLACGQPAKVR